MRGGRRPTVRTLSHTLYNYYGQIARILRAFYKMRVTARAPLLTSAAIFIIMGDKGCFYETAQSAGGQDDIRHHRHNTTDRRIPPARQPRRAAHPRHTVGSGHPGRGHVHARVAIHRRGTGAGRGVHRHSAADRARHAARRQSGVGDAAGVRARRRFHHLPDVLVQPPLPPQDAAVYGHTRARQEVHDMHGRLRGRSGRVRRSQPLPLQRRFRRAAPLVGRQVLPRKASTASASTR